MTNRQTDLQFVVIAMPARGSGPNELERTMARHPLIYQELPYNPRYSVYNRRLACVGMDTASAEEMYWMVRRKVILRHTGELPTEIRGPDAEKLLDRVFTRDISKVKVGGCSYQFACYPDGGMIVDGILLRLGKDRFWYAQADGDFFSWLVAHAQGLHVDVFDPEVWVSQVQGPDSLKVLAAAVDGGTPDPFRFYDLAEVYIAGQRVFISRTGFTNELGWEFYLEPDVDAQAIGDRILEAGMAHDMVPVSAEGFRTRRIEAGLLNAGSDFDPSVTPYAAGLGHMVDLDKADFIGKTALEAADKRRRTWGLCCQGGVSGNGETVTRNGEQAGVVCSSAWSPFQQCGVAIVRLGDPDLGPGTKIDVECTDGQTRSAEICDTPMYDQAREIARGKLIDIPQMPEATKDGNRSR